MLYLKNLTLILMYLTTRDIKHSNSYTWTNPNNSTHILKKIKFHFTPKISNVILKR